MHQHSTVVPGLLLSKPRLRAVEHAEKLKLLQIWLTIFAFMHFRTPTLFFLLISINSAEVSLTLLFIYIFTFLFLS